MRDEVNPYYQTPVRKEHFDVRGMISTACAIRGKNVMRESLQADVDAFVAAGGVVETLGTTEQLKTLPKGMQDINYSKSGRGRRTDPVNGDPR